MAIEVLVPRLGWTMEEGTFGGWLKNDGDAVLEGEPLFALESEKATQEVEAIESGFLRIPNDSPPSGAVVEVGDLLGYILQTGEPEPDAGARATSSATRERAAETEGRPLAKGPRAVQETPPSAGSRAAISPRARRVAGELGVDWTTLKGSGRSGRIEERDVRLAAEGAHPAEASTAAGRAVPHSRMRRLIAEHMAASAHSTAAVTLTTEADATELVQLRDELKAGASPGEATPTYTDLIVKLTQMALNQHESLNAHFTDDALVIFDDIHIAIAVETDKGLVAPVLRDVAKKDLTAIAKESRSLRDRARSQKLGPDELQGGTFTITNLGTYGIDAFTPIINANQCAILGIGRIRLEPAVHEDRVVPRNKIALSLTFDHRAVDGAPAAEFLGTVRELIEAPDKWQA